MSVSIINCINGVSIVDGKLIMNGKEYKTPRSPIGGNSISQINGKTFINGHEFVNGKFKITLRALWYLVF